MQTTTQITLKTTKPDLEPLESERLNNWAAGFADSVKKVTKKAKRLDKNSLWGWCDVEVTATCIGPHGLLTSSTYLCGCSYEDAADFMVGGYYADMVKTVMDDIINKLEESCKSSKETSKPSSSGASSTGAAT